MAKQTQVPGAKPTKKVHGIKVTVVGQAATKGDRRTDLIKFSESFFLPESARKEALHIVRRFLIDQRLMAKEASFRFVRTCGIKTIDLADDTGLSTLEAKDIDTMTGEEIRTLVIFKGWPRELIEDVAVDFDLIERVQDFMKNPHNPLRNKKRKLDEEALEQQEALEDGELGNSTMPAAKTTWKDLDA